jgi:hypothetical protein
VCYGPDDGIVESMRADVIDNLIFVRIIFLGTIEEALLFVTKGVIVTFYGISKKDTNVP